MKDRLVKDSGPGCSASGLSLLLQNRCHRYSHLCIGCAENIDQKAHKFRGDLELTVVECFDLPGSPSKDSADVGDKWEVSVTPAEYSEGPPDKSKPLTAAISSLFTEDEDFTTVSFSACLDTSVSSLLLILHRLSSPDGCCCLPPPYLAHIFNKPFRILVQCPSLN